jgi:hypothetical protein
MEQSAPNDLRRIWRQDEVPVIVRKGKGHKLRVKLPHPSVEFEPLRRARAFLQAARPKGRRPDWLQQYRGWEVSQDWFSDLVDHVLKRFSKLYIIQPYREQEKCAAACMNAQGHECQCSCMGANHGAGGPGAGWFEVSETFATRWGDEQLACRLMERTAAAGPRSVAGDGTP